VVTHAELWAGVRSGEEDTVADLLAALGSIDVDADIARTAGGFQQRYGRSHGVALADALIAATAVQHGLLLVTRDQRHYPMHEVKLWSGLRPLS
jgi:predicted nucleic acid-binding protein